MELFGLEFTKLAATKMLTIREYIYEILLYIIFACFLALSKSLTVACLLMMSTKTSHQQNFSTLC